MSKILQAMTRTFSTFSWCLSFAWKASCFYTIVRVVSQIAAPLLVVSLSFIGKFVLDLLADSTASEKTQGMLLFLLSTLLVVRILHAVINKVNQYCHAMHEDMIKGKISLMLIERALSADLEFFDNPEYYNKLTSASRDTHTISGIVWSALTCISATISFFAAFSILCRVNVLYGVIMVAASFPSSVISARYIKLVYKMNLEHVGEERKIGYYQSIATDRDYAQDLRLFNAGIALKTRYKKIFGKLFLQRQGAIRRRSIFSSLLECLPEIAAALIGADIAFRVLRDIASIGEYSLYTGLLGQLWSAVILLSSSAMQVYDNRLRLENIRLLDTIENRVLDTGRCTLKKVNSIEFDNVSFTYPGARSPSLDSVSFLISIEEKVVFVGLNGSGKSTLIKLILRMYDPDSGIIKLNGIDIREYRLAELRANFSVYFQGMHNFSFSIKENFTITDNDTAESDSDLIKALDAACCGDLLRNTQNDLDTALTRYFDPKGVELSGGQHQKLALARVLYRRHSALILDEPSSNLDPEAEHTIFKSLEKLTDGKLTIFTSHRLSNVSLADRIIVLENGRIIEEGTQAELLKNKQRYSELFRYQQEKYIEKDNEYARSTD